VERSQELLYEINLFVENNLIEGGIQVFFDSPLAQKATRIFERYTQLYDEDARRLIESGDEVFDFEGLHYVEKFNDSRRLAARTGIIIIAGSGMCNGGRILYHLENNVADPNNHLVFAGYQVKGTRGRELVDGAESIRLRGKLFQVNLQVHTLGGFSAHGDQADLEYWLRAFGSSPRKVFLVHGDDDIVGFFADYVRKNLKQDVHVPELNEEVELD
jgi:metallo-beta-lactamase family protein